MMGRALLIVGAMSTLGVIAAAVAGYTLHGPTDANMPLHVLIGLASSLLLLFSHCWIMFYLIGTGKAIKDAVRENGLDPAIIEETKRFKNESYPWLMLAMGLVMATFILGGGVATGSVPSRPLLSGGGGSRVCPVGRAAGADRERAPDGGRRPPSRRGSGPDGRPVIDPGAET
jgi:hypothetical protein